MFDREIGGVKTPHRIIERQRGPECGYEAVENVIQLVYPVGNNNVSEEDLKSRAAYYGFAIPAAGQSVLDPRGYRQLLADYGIASTWVRFNADQLVEILRQNRVAIAIVDPAVLDPATYPPTNELHAVVVTNFGVDSRIVIRYTGIDSNFQGTERHWPWERFHNAITAAGGLLLITDDPISPLYWGTYDILTLNWQGLTFVPSEVP